MRRENAGRATGVELIPLLKDEAAACRGGQGENPLQQLIDWVTGANPRPDQWPPQIA